MTAEQHTLDQCHLQEECHIYRVNKCSTVNETGMGHTAHHSYARAHHTGVPWKQRAKMQPLKKNRRKKFLHRYTTLQHPLVSYCNP